LRLGNKIANGAYGKKIERIQSSTSPNFFILIYEPINFGITNFFVIPKHFFVPSLIEKRNALSEDAERAKWVGSNILINRIPETGKIFYIKDGSESPKATVISNWKKTLFLREEKQLAAKGWILDVMKCIDKLDKHEFWLEEVYRFEDELKALHPDNQYIQAKIRQQLQLLRDKGYLQFTGGGYYRLS